MLTANERRWLNLPEVDSTPALGQRLAKLHLLPLHRTSFDSPRSILADFTFFLLLFFPTRLLTVSVFLPLCTLYVLRCSSNSCNCCLLAACRRFVPATFTSFQHQLQLQLQHQLHGLYFYLNESRKHVVALCCLLHATNVRLACQKNYVLIFWFRIAEVFSKNPWQPPCETKKSNCPPPKVPLSATN